MFWTVGRIIGMLAATVAVAASVVFVLPPPWLGGDSERVVRWRRRSKVAALSAGVLAWALAPFWAITNGVKRFEKLADPAYGHIAGEAIQGAWMLNDNPIGRLAMPVVRVRRVWRDPGHCPAGDPGGREPYADWRAEVRFYTYFGIPGPVARITCGGWAW